MRTVTQSRRLYLILLLLLPVSSVAGQDSLRLSDRGYLHMHGLDVTVFSDFYPEGHQSGVTIIQHGSRVAANGDLRLEPSPGQWSPVPAGSPVRVDKAAQTISKELRYPDPAKDRAGFNPVCYPDLRLDYRVSVHPAGGSSFLIRVDLEEALPPEWTGRVGFNLELFPGELFGKAYLVDGRPGIFTRQPAGPMEENPAASAPGPEGSFKPDDYPGPHGDPYSEALTGVLDRGHTLVIAPEDPMRKMVIWSRGQELELRDGRSNHNNGWFIVRSVVPAGAAAGAVEWLVTPNVVEGWKYGPVIQVSQLGYHPAQEKVAVLELDPEGGELQDFCLYRADDGGSLPVLQGKPVPWGEFLRYRYATVDFSRISTPGVYVLSCGGTDSHPFRIAADVYSRDTWQATLEYFLPVQMCHMRVNEKYRVWHGLCHMDDARMAPTDTLHFDGYKQGHSTLTRFSPGEHAPGLASGGWHDAGDYDLRVESQAGTVRMLAMMIEEFGLDYDATSIDPVNRIVEIHVPDGKPDATQQMEHGLASILGGYRSLGRLYRGIICPTLRQYVMLGDAASMTDNRIYGTDPETGQASQGKPGVPDDRWVFTEDNPGRELIVAASLANASRVLRAYNPPLAEECLEVSRALWQQAKGRTAAAAPKVQALTELILTTGDPQLLDELESMKDAIVSRIGDCWVLGRLVSRVEMPSGGGGTPVLKLDGQSLEVDPDFLADLARAVAGYEEQVGSMQAKDSPYGVPYRPAIWGAGWNIQEFGVEQYFFHKGWPDLAPAAHFEHALNFILGVHPGSNDASFVSGVGARSVTTAYGVNRADWSYIPGGVASGTALIRPDLPELKVWPFFWQQTEYVMGGGATDFMFLVLAVDSLYREKDK